MKPIIIPLVLIASSACLMRCEPAAGPMRTFTTPAGAHYAHPRLVQTL